MESPITLVSWNVNGLRAMAQKDFQGSIRGLNADIVAVQETKLQGAQLVPALSDLPGYTSCWSHCEVKKGYSGVGVYTRIPPRAVRHGIGQPRFDSEGRILELDYGSFVLLNVYFPNGGMSEERLQYKLDFYEAFFEYADEKRGRGRSLVICGDYNTAHREIDLAHPQANRNTSGFLAIERAWVDRIVSRGYVDTFRHFHPDEVKYSWWTYRFRARERNIGWRIDYVFVTSDLIESGRVGRAFIDNDVHGSDHCPVGLSLAI